MLKEGGQLRTFYHGTSVVFDAFRPLSHFGTRDVAETYAAKKDAVRGELLSVETILAENDGEPKYFPKSVVIPAHLKMNNPLLLSESCVFLSQFQDKFFYEMLRRQWGVHYLKEYVASQIAVDSGNATLFGDMLKGRLGYVRNDYISKESALFTDLFHRIDFLPEWRFVFDDPMTCPYELVKKELALENLYPVLPDTDRLAERRNREHLVVQRMIRAYESMGYDGILYAPYQSDVDKLRYEYAIIFRPESVERLDKEVAFPERSFVAQKEATLAQIKADRLREMTVQPLTKEELFRIDIGLSSKSKKMQAADKRYWTDFAFTNILPEVAQISHQSPYDKNGLARTEQTVLLGIQLALTENVRPLPVVMACALRTCTKETTIREFLSKHRLSLTDKESEQIVTAIMDKNSGRKAANGIEACLWDAERTPIAWARGYEAEAFATQTGKAVASSNFAERETLIKQQYELLSEHLEWNSALMQSVRRKKAFWRECCAMNNQPNAHVYGG